MVCDGELAPELTPVGGVTVSYELIGILILGGLSLVEIAALIISILLTMRGFREMSWIQRAVAGLIVQESEKIQTLLREASG